MKPESLKNNAMTLSKVCIFLILALSLIITCTEAPPEDTGENRREYVQEGMTAYGEGNYKKAIEKFKKAHSLDTTTASVAYNIACCYSLLNEKDSAIAWIEKTIDLGTYLFVEDKDFDNIRESKEFKQVVEKAESLLKIARNKEWPSHVFIPDNYDSTETYPLFIMLHGYGSSPEDFTGALADSLTGWGFIYVVPYGTEIYGLSSFGWGDIKMVKNKIENDINNLKEKYSIDNFRIILGGYSQGGHRSLTISIKNPELFKGAISVAGYFEEEKVKDYLPGLKDKDLRVYMIAGGKDEGVYKTNTKANEILTEHGLEVHLEVFPDVGHAFPGKPVEEIKKAIDFIEKN